MSKRVPTHPGRFIKRNYLDVLGITAVELAEALGVHKTTLSRLLNEKSDLSPRLVARISAVLGGSPGSWMNLQTNHSLAKLEAEAESGADAWKPKATLKGGALVANYFPAGNYPVANRAERRAGGSSDRG